MGENESQAVVDHDIDRPIEEAAPLLLTEIRRVLKAAERDIPPAPSTPRLRRAAVRVRALEPLIWLNAQESAERMYWSGRDRDGGTAGIGATDIVFERDTVDYAKLADRVMRRLKGADDALRYYGGIQFQASPRREACWRRFGGWRFVLPRFELCNRDGRSFFVCNLDSDRDASRSDEDWMAEIGRVARRDADLDGELPAPLNRTDSPDRAGWERNVEAALEAFRRGDLQKIVLARRSAFEFDQHLNPIALLFRLKSATPDCFHFCFMPDHATAFIGASPERLYRRDGRAIRSEAVAGTRPRGGDPEHDERVAHELLNSEKDLREHNYVRDAIRNDLEPLCVETEPDGETTLLRLARGQHLFTEFKARLKEGVGDDEVLSRLHPTPALGGHPTEPALRQIERLEPFERGWYGGPVGWIGRDGVEFAVAIRSGLVAPYGLSIYSGAGIVQGSTPDEEWDEIENKISDFIKVLTGT